MVPGTEFESFPPTEKLHKRKPRKKNKSLRILGLIILMTFLSATAYAGYVFYKLNQFGETVSVGKKEEAWQKLEEPIGIVLMGMDSREETGSLNTDVIMVAVLNPKTKAVTVVSIPRDTYVRVEGFRRGKANAFYSRGEAARIKAEHNKETVTVTGPSLAKDVFSGFLDVPIQHYVTIDFEGFRQVVDALGGIEVNVDQDMRYVDSADGTDINLKKGVQVLSGKEALDFVRFRQSNRGGPDSNDIERNLRQQQVISTVIDELTSLNGFVKVGQILDIAGEHIRTDLPKSTMRSIVMTFAGTQSEDVRFLSIIGDWQSPYIRVSEQELAEISNTLKATRDGSLLPPSSVSKPVDKEHKSSN